MEKPAAFDLNRALHNWRAHLTDSSSVNRENLDELETHLRDSVFRLCQAGLSEQEAWIIAEMRFGQTKTLGEEFEKVQRPAHRRRLSERQFIGVLLAGFALVTLEQMISQGEVAAAYFSFVVIPISALWVGVWAWLWNRRLNVESSARSTAASASTAS